MQRTRTVLTFLILGCFTLLAVLPFTGIRLPELASAAWSSLSEEAAPKAVFVETAGTTFNVSSLADIDPELAKAAVYALANNLAEDEVSVLFDIVNADLDIGVRKAALFAVGNFDTADVHDFLGRVAVSEQNVHLAKAAAHALGNSDSDTAVTALITIVGSDADKDVRKAAVYALGNADSPRAREALIGLLQNR